MLIFTSFLLVYNKIHLHWEFQNITTIIYETIYEINILLTTKCIETKCSILLLNLFWNGMYTYFYTKNIFVLSVSPLYYILSRLWYLKKKKNYLLQKLIDFDAFKLMQFLRFWVV